MKKLLALALALVLCLSFSTAAFADEKTVTSTDETNNTATQAVTATTEDTTTKVYSVNVAWGAMTFKWTQNKGSWNTTTHTYTGGNSSWAATAEGANVVTITNHSNAPIHAVLAVAAKSDVENADSITYTVVNGTAGTDEGTYGVEGAGVLNLTSAENTLGDGGVPKATAGTFTITLSGTPKNAAAQWSDSTAIATATVTITAGT